MLRRPARIRHNGAVKEPFLCRRGAIERAARRSTLPGLLVLGLGCSGGGHPLPPSAPPPLPARAGATPSSTSSPPPSLAAPADSVPEGMPEAGSGTPCGPLECRSFASVEAAFRHVLVKRPRVLALGEAHPQRGTEHVEPASRRFGRELLPLLEGQASDIVIELLLSPGNCQQTERQVAERQAEVTAPQAASNQNDFVTLGHVTKSQGIVPHALTPTCDQLEPIVQSGGGDIAAMLTLVAELSQARIEALLDANAARGAASMVLAYGGALHNDITPRPGRETWTFGPALREKLGEGYVELDLIVPEYIKPDSEVWSALPWVAHYDPARLGDRAVVYRLSPGSYVLVFPVTPLTQSPPSGLSLPDGGGAPGGRPPS